MGRCTNLLVEVEVLRVFCDEHSEAGNRLGVVLEAQAIQSAHRQAIAAALGYSETIFVQEEAQIAIFTPTSELAFAGHPLVGAAWRLGAGVLHPPAGPVPAGATEDRAWILARPEQSPPWDLRQASSPRELDALIPPVEGHILHWAWSDEAAGRIKARAFAADYGIVEDPATGSAAMVLCGSLSRPIVIEQGEGSIIKACPVGEGAVELGGRVLSEGIRRVEIRA